MIEKLKVLLISDDEAVAKYLKEKLAIIGGYQVFCEFKAEIALEAFRQNNFDLVVAQFSMPDLDGIALIEGLKKVDPDCTIVVIIKDGNTAILGELANLGIYDFIIEPVNSEKLLFLVRKGTELHLLTLAHRKLKLSLQEQNIALQKQNTLLAKRIEESTKNLSRLYEDLRSTYMRTIKSLAQAIDARDHYTHSHSKNVAKYAVAIAEVLQLSAKDTELIREASELHDLGKIGISDDILIKPSELNPVEWEEMKRHPLTAAQILEPLTFLEGVIELIKQHHEHYDGSGYPLGLSGKDILLGARVIHLSDAYDAMCSARSYREIAFSKEEAVLEIKQKTGTQFDPLVVEAFLKIVNKL